MDTTVDLATQIFEFLEDDYQFDYHLKKSSKNSVIRYYKDNTTIEITVHCPRQNFNLNLKKEKDNSFTITSVTDKLIYYADTGTANELENAKEKLMDYMD